MGNVNNMEAEELLAAYAAGERNFSGANHSIAVYSKPGISRYM
jgi:hypothetical protein